MKIKHISILVFITIFVLSINSLAHAQSPTYAIADLGAGNALDINNKGQVVGVDGNAHAFMYSSLTGTNQDLGPGTAYGINENSQVVGEFPFGSRRAEHAFLYSNGSMADLGTLGGDTSLADGINDSGQVVGWTTDGGNTRHAFLYSNAVTHDLGEGVVTGINNSGQMVGQDSTYQEVFFFPDGTRSSPFTPDTGASFSGPVINTAGHIAGVTWIAFGWPNGFLYSNNTLLHLGGLSQDTYGRSMSGALGINNSDQIVGWSDTVNGSQGPQHAFLYSNSTMSDLNNLIDPTSGWTLQQANAINDCGQIVGYGTNSTGQTDAFLLTPTTSSCPQSRYTIIASAGSHGSITPSGHVSVVNGANQTFTITADKGFKISDIQVDGSSVGHISTYTFNAVSGNHTITASFTGIPNGDGSCTETNTHDSKQDESHGKKCTDKDHDESSKEKSKDKDDGGQNETKGHR
jgi:probable HAF family extracellular repeat protein